jgi:hypothetical protein
VRLALSDDEFRVVGWGVLGREPSNEPWEHVHLA